MNYLQTFIRNNPGLLVAAFFIKVFLVAIAIA